MKDRFYMGKVGNVQVVIDLNKINGDQTSLDGRLVGQTPENGPTRKPGYSVVRGKLVWNTELPASLLIEAQIYVARLKKAGFQGAEFCPNLRV